MGYQTQGGDGALHNLANEDQFKGLAAAADGGSTKSVSNTSSTLAAANPARKALVIQNWSLTCALTISGNDTAVFKGGLTIPPAEDATHPSGPITILGSTYTGAVTGIMSAADATENNVSVMEI
jgi:sporulation-control protein spo0M